MKNKTQNNARQRKKNLGILKSGIQMNKLDMVIGYFNY